MMKANLTRLLCEMSIFVFTLLRILCLQSDFTINKKLKIQWN